MVRSPLVLAYCLYSINSAFAVQPLYNLKDLEVLERDKNFEEFLLHVNDIRPSERDKHWREMYQSMAMGQIDYKIKTKDFTKPAFEQIEQISRNSALSKDEFFQLKRSIYAKKYFAECFKKTEIVSEAEKKSKDKNICESELNSFWYFSKKDADTGLDLAGILESNASTLNRWPFYSPAVKDSIANFYCQKPNVQSAVIKKIYEESYNSDFDGHYKNLIERVVSDKCFDELIAPLKSTLSSINSSGLDKEMAMNLLEAKGKLTSEEKDLYAILYLLDGPVVGDKMNIAWKKVEALTDNFQKRQKLLSEIKKLQVIPDKIFKDPNLPRHKAIINLFARNFPEYLDYYGTACVKFLKNDSLSTINVSSSFQCSEFLKAAEANRSEKTSISSPWISDSVHSQYSALKHP
jgi:hypothetical protein